MAGAKGFSVFVNIGGKVAPSFTGAINTVESRLARLGRNASTYAKGVKTAWGEVAAASKGVAGIAAAGGITVGLKHAIGSGAHLAHEMQALKNAGRTTIEFSEAMAQANKTMLELPTSTLTSNLGIIKETTAAFGDFHHALENLTFNQKLGSVLKNTIGDKAGEPAEMFNKLVRAFEIRGTAGDKATYQREAAELGRAMIFSGGKVNADEFLMYAQRGNPAIKNLGERYLTKIAPSLIQEMGGDIAGSQLSAFRSTIMGRVRDKTQTGEWKRLGLLDPKMLVGGNGSPIAFKAGAMKNTNVALTDPLEWFEKTLLPAMTKAGIDTNDQLAVSKELGVLFRNSNANRFAEVHSQARDRTRLHKDEGLIDKVKPVDEAYKENLKNDPKVGLEALKSSIDNFGSALMNGPVKEATPLLVGLAESLNKFSSVLMDNKGLATGLAALALGLGGFAALKLLEMAAGVTALATALTTLPSAIKAAQTGVAMGANDNGGVRPGVANDNGPGKVKGPSLWKALAFFSGAAGAVANAPKTPEDTQKNAVALDRMVRSVMPDFVSKLFTPIEPAAAEAGQKAGEKIGEATRSAIEAANLGEAGKKLAETAKAGVEGATLSDAGRKLAETAKTGVESESLTESGRKLAETGKSGLESVDYTSAGSAVGEKGKQGLLSVDYTGAGAQAGNQLLTGFRSAIGGGGLGIAIPKKLDGARAAGGPVRAGGAYLVGENGPEIFTPGRTGGIDTNATLAKLSAAGRAPERSGTAGLAASAAATSAEHSVTVHGGDTTIHVTVNASGNADGQDIGRKVSAAVRSELRKLQSEQRGLLSD